LTSASDRKNPPLNGPRVPPHEDARPTVVAASPGALRGLRSHRERCYEPGVPRLVVERPLPPGATSRAVSACGWWPGELEHCSWVGHDGAPFVVVVYMCFTTLANAKCVYFALDGAEAGPPASRGGITATFELVCRPGTLVSRVEGVALAA
jgi:hypothetical protein